VLLTVGAAHQVLAAAEVQARGRLVEQQQLRVGHQRAGDQGPLALALGQRAEGALAELGHAPPGQQVVGALRVGLVVLLTPAADHAVGGGHHDIAHRLAARQLLGDRGGGVPDARPQLENVDRAEALAEHAHRARGREQRGGRDVQHRGLARAVGPEDDPALAFADRPVHRVQQLAALADHRNVDEVEDAVWVDGQGIGGHVRHQFPHAGRPRSSRAIA